MTRLPRLLAAAILPMALVLPAAGAVDAPPPVAFPVPPRGSIVLVVALSDGTTVNPLASAVVANAYCMAVVP